MKNHSIQITHFDAARLGTMLDQAIRERRITTAEATNLRAELSHAKIVEPEAIPPGVVTMNSTIDLMDLETGEPETYTLVFPENANGFEGRVSVLAPIGTAMLGYGVGDILKSEVPSGTRRLEVKNVVYQPEASGDFDL